LLSWGEFLKRTEYPSKGELVVVRIKRIVPHGAFVDLVEYGKEGFIHISHISSSWVKNIRSHISEGQMRVALVIHVDPRKRLIDVSLRNVRSNQEKRKIAEWKREKKAEKLLDLVAKHFKVSLEDAYKIAGWKLEDEYGEIYSAFEEMVTEGEKALEGIDIPVDWKKYLVEIAKKYVELPKVELSGEMTIAIPGSDGVTKLKEILSSIEKEGVKVVYQGAPKYFIKLVSTDYKAAEDQLKRIVDDVSSKVKKAGGKFEFKRIED